MNGNLPYIYVDDECDFNLGILLIIIDRLALSSRMNYKLDFDRIQIFMYLVKNPSKINKVLEVAGKKYIHLQQEQLYTIESLSQNVDILFMRSKVKFLIKKLASMGALKVIDDSKNGISYFLSEKGEKIALELNDRYYVKTVEIVDGISSLLSLSSSRLLTVLSIAFSGK